jgi:hypothetical protein
MDTRRYSDFKNGDRIEYPEDKIFEDTEFTYFRVSENVYAELVDGYRDTPENKVMTIIDVTDDFTMAIYKHDDIYSLVKIT